jgi:DNA-binding CsgD family transcriptional regulator
MRKQAVLAAVLLVQVLSAVFLVADIASSYVGLWSAPLSWEMREYLELSAATGLTLGVGFGIWVLRRTLRERNLCQERLHRASGAFMNLVDERFGEWGLTPAEKDVALFAIKGLATAEIAVLRATSEGTVKAQTNAIYRKAGVSGRSQLLSLFIEDLMRAPHLLTIWLKAQGWFHALSGTDQGLWPLPILGQADRYQQPLWQCLLGIAQSQLPWHQLWMANSKRPPIRVPDQWQKRRIRSWSVLSDMFSENHSAREYRGRWPSDQWQKSRQGTNRRKACRPLDCPPQPC